MTAEEPRSTPHGVRAAGRWRRVMAAAVATAMLVVVVAAVASLWRADRVPAGSVARVPWLHSNGVRFVDRSKTPVALHGVDVGVGRWLTDQRAVALGVNFVRITIAWSDVEPHAPDAGHHTWNSRLLGKLDREVRLFARAHVNVLIDFHQNGWSSYFDAPGTRYPSRGIPSWYYSGSGVPRTLAGRHRAEAAFWTSGRARSLAAYEAFADMMVRRYRGFPNVLGYEVLNEPPPGTLGAGPRAAAAVLGWEAKVAGSMRRLDPYRTIFVMGAFAGLGVPTTPPDAFRDVAGIGLDFHDYFNGLDGYGLTKHADRWYPSWRATHMQATARYAGTFSAQLSLLRRPLQEARGWGVPLLIGEWGDKQHTVGARRYQSQMLHAMSELHLNWARWTMDRGGGYDLLDDGHRFTSQARQLEAYLHAGNGAE